MKDKLINIKNFLRIVICCFVIFNFAKSCAHAAAVTIPMLPRDTEIDKAAALEKILDHYQYSADLENVLSANNKTKWESYKSSWCVADYSLIYIAHNSNSGGDYQNQCYMYYLNNKSQNKVNPASSLNSNSVTYQNTPYAMIYRNRINDSAFTFTKSTGNLPYQNMTYYYILLQDNEGYWYEYSFDNWKILDNLIQPLNFVFHDNSRTTFTPSGQTATCVFLNPIASYQNIGYLDDYASVKDDPSFTCSIFGSNYRNLQNVQVGNIGDSNWYFDDSGNLWVATGTMWSRLVYEITGGTSQRTFDVFYYIAAGDNFSGDPRFYSGDNYKDDNGLEDDPSFNLWKTIGGFFSGSGDGSGDGSFGIVGGIGNLFKGFFIPDQTQVHNFIESKISVVGANTGEVLSKPSVVFGLLLNKMYSSGDFIIDIPTLSLPGSFVYGSQSNNPDVVIYNGESVDSQINFTQLVQNEPYKTIYDYYIVIISGVYLFLFFAYLWSLWDHFMHSREIDYTLSDINRRL